MEIIDTTNSILDKCDGKMPLLFLRVRNAPDELIESIANPGEWEISAIKRLVLGVRSSNNQKRNGFLKTDFFKKEWQFTEVKNVNAQPLLENLQSLESKKTVWRRDDHGFNMKPLVFPAKKEVVFLYSPPWFYDIANRAEMEIILSTLGKTLSGAFGSVTKQTSCHQSVVNNERFVSLNFRIGKSMKEPETEII